MIGMSTGFGGGVGGVGSCLFQNNHAPNMSYGPVMSMKKNYKLRKFAHTLWVPRQSAENVGTKYEHQNIVKDRDPGNFTYC